MESSIQYSPDVSACVVQLTGEIDMVTVPQLREGLQGALARGCSHVVLDLGQVTYADSSVFSLLVWLDRELQPVGGKLVLAGASGNVNRVLELSGLVGVAPCISSAPDVNEAVSGLELAAGGSPALWSESMTMAADPASLAETRARVVELLEPLGIGESTLFDIRVAVGEALANAIRHGSPGGDADNVEIRIDAHEDRVVIVVDDCGGGFDGCTRSCDDLYAASGRGVMFMRALMDQVEFSVSHDGGTSVTMVKHILRHRR